jgi:hypothetical protein
VHFRDRPSSLTDPTSPVFGALSTAVMGALPLIDPSRLDPMQNRVLHAATAAATGFYTAVTVDRNRTTLVPLNVIAGIAAAAAAVRFADAGDALDTRLVLGLSSAGVRHPRRWLAAGSAALTFGMFLADRAAARREEYEAVSLDELAQVRPLTPAVRELVEGMLRAADVPGAAALLSQLEHAEEVYWDEDFVSTVQFKVPDDVPRAVPFTHVFPVTARYVAENGLPLQVMLQVFDGKIEHLAIDVVTETEESIEGLEDVLDRWPDPDKVQYFIEGSDGTSHPVRKSGRS